MTDWAALLDADDPCGVLKALKVAWLNRLEGNVEASVEYTDYKVSLVGVSDAAIQGVIDMFERECAKKTAETTGTRMLRPGIAVNR